jgi:hypothetical protein
MIKLNLIKYAFGHNANTVECTRSLNEEQYEQLKDMIRDSYNYRLYLDDLPSATVNRHQINNKLYVSYFDGIPLGLYSSTTDKVILYNHLDITVFTHSTLDGNERIVGFEVEPMSINENKDRLDFDTFSSSKALHPEGLDPSKNYSRS